MAKMSLWRSAAAQEGRKLPCLPTACCACTPCMCKAGAGSWKCSTLNETELGGVKEAIFSVDGAGAYNRLKYESGVHRVQRVPETETQGRIHTSTATVAVMPQAEEVDFALDMKDLRIDTFRSSGAGGQHINKTSSAIRVTHLPTGMVVECQNERSQFQNKDKALEILRSRLLAQKQKRAAGCHQRQPSGAGRHRRPQRKRSAPTTSRRTAAPITPPPPCPSKIFKDHGRQSGRADRRTGHPRTGRKAAKAQRAGLKCGFENKTISCR